MASETAKRSILQHNINFIFSKAKVKRRICCNILSYLWYLGIFFCSCRRDFLFIYKSIYTVRWTSMVQIYSTPYCDIHVLSYCKLQRLKWYKNKNAIIFFCYTKYPYPFAALLAKSKPDRLKQVGLSMDFKPSVILSSLIFFPYNIIQRNFSF